VFVVDVAWDDEGHEGDPEHGSVDGNEEAVAEGGGIGEDDELGMVAHANGICRHPGVEPLQNVSERSIRGGYVGRECHKPFASSMPPLSSGSLKASWLML